MRKKLTISLLIGAAVIAAFVSGCAQEAGSVNVTVIPESAGGQNTLQPALSNVASVWSIVSEEVPLPSGMTAHGTFSADLDSNGVLEKIIVCGIINEHGEEDVSLIVFDGHDLIQGEVLNGYFKSAFLTRTQSGEVCVIISVDRGSEDYMTSVFSFSRFEPKLRKTVGAYVSIVSGTHITMEDYTDSLGSWYYYQEFLLTDSFILKPSTDFRIKMSKKEPLHTIKELPVDMLVNNVYGKQMLDVDTFIYPESTDGESYMIFKLESGTEGKIILSEPESDSYGSFFYIDGVSEYEYFDNIEYWD